VLAIFFVPVSFDVVERLAHRGKHLPPTATPAIVPSEGD
jgi:hypothetical protein